MTATLAIILRVYGFLLWLYPRSYRREFEEQMLLDFTDMIADARERGRFSFVFFCLRELIDFPFNLLRVHLREGRMFKILRLQPVSMGLRGAVGFGIGFAAAAVALWGVSSWLFSTFDPQIQYLSVWIYDTFHNDQGTTILWGILSALSSALTGIVFGLVFALFFGDRTKFFKYTLAGALAWFIPDTVSYVLFNSFGWSFFLNERQTYVLGISISLLTGTFWGAIISFAENDRKVSLRYLVAGVIGYPLSAYLFVKLLFYLWLEITPWFFTALMFLMTLLIGSVITIVALSNRKMVWLIIAGAFGYYILSRVAFYISYTFLHFPTPPLGVSIPPGDFIVYQISGIGSQAIFGVLFGLILGLVFGYQRKNTQTQTAGI